MSDRKKLKPTTAWGIRNGDYLVPSSVRLTRSQAIKDWCDEDDPWPWSWWRRQGARTVKVTVTEDQS